MSEEIERMKLPGRLRLPLKGQRVRDLRTLILVRKPLPHDSIDMGRWWLDTHLGSGEVCPVCDRFAKIYRWNFNWGMVISLIWLVKYYREELPTSTSWVYVPARSTPKAVTKTRQWDKLKLWGLIEPKPNKQDPKKRCSGLWRPTARGEALVDGEITVPAKMYFYARKCLGFSKQETTLKKALQEEFDYEELMQGRWIRAVKHMSQGRP